MKTSDELLQTLGPKLYEMIAPYWNGADARLLNEAIATVVLAVLTVQNVEPSQQLRDQFTVTLGTPMLDVQQQYIIQILAQVNGNKSQAARIMGIDRGTLSRLLGEGGIVTRFVYRKPNRPSRPRVRSSMHSV